MGNCKLLHKCFEHLQGPDKTETKKSLKESPDQTDIRLTQITSTWITSGDNRTGVNY